jgi:hypothetical protein
VFIERYSLIHEAKLRNGSGKLNNRVFAQGNIHYTSHNNEMESAFIDSVNNYLLSLSNTISEKKQGEDDIPSMSSKGYPGKHSQSTQRLTQFLSDWIQKGGNS